MGKHLGAYKLNHECITREVEVVKPYFIV